VVGSGPGKINREEIAAIVDRFLANRPEEMPGPSSRQADERAQQPPPPPVEAEAGSMYTGRPSQAERLGENRGENSGRAGNGGRSSSSAASTSRTSAAANGNAPVDFVSEDDVKRAIQKGDKIFINSKTIITPAARDIGEPAEVFAKT